MRNPTFTIDPSTLSLLWIAIPLRLHLVIHPQNRLGSKCRSLSPPTTADIPGIFAVSFVGQLKSLLSEVGMASSAKVELHWRAGEDDRTGAVLGY